MRDQSPTELLPRRSCCNFCHGKRRRTVKFSKFVRSRNTNACTCIAYRLSTISCYVSLRSSISPSLQRDACRAPVYSSMFPDERVHVPQARIHLRCAIFLETRARFHVSVNGSRRHSCRYGRIKATFWRHRYIEFNETGRPRLTEVNSSIYAPIPLGNVSFSLFSSFLSLRFCRGSRSRIHNRNLLHHVFGLHAS